MHDPTTLPDAGPGNKFAHSASVFQTRVLQKLGKLEKSLDYTPEFRTFNDRAKDFLIAYEEILRTTRRYFSVHKGLADAQVLHAELIQRFATDVQKEHETLSTELRRIGDNNKQFAQLRIAWDRDGAEAFAAGLDRFLREVTVARKAKDEFRESRIELETVEGKLRSLQAQRAPDISALYLQQTQVSACRQKFENCWTDAFTKLSDVDTKRDLDLLLVFIAFIEAQQKHWLSMLSVVAELESTANLALEQAYLHRMNDEQRRDKRAADRAASIAQAESTKWNSLLSLLSNKDLALFTAIAGASDTDEILEIIVKVLEQQSIVFPIMFDQIAREVSKTDSTALLFRGNTIGTKIMMNYVRFSGKQYLLSTLAPLLAEIVELGNTLEIDPNKLAKGQDLAENMARYKRTCKRCFDAIVASLPAAPRSFREVARFLNNEVTRKFPNSKFQGVAGMVFLRFFCPGISAPDSYGLMESKQLQPDNRRALILISKVLQNTANNAMFSQKEPYMQDMNSFVEEHIPVVNKFFADFIDLDAKPAVSTPPTFDPNTSPDCLEIYRFILAHMDAIGKNLISNNQETMVGTLAEALAQIWSHLPESEGQLGPVYRRQGTSALSRSSGAGSKPIETSSRASVASSPAAPASSASPTPPSPAPATPPAHSPAAPQHARSASPLPGAAGGTSVPSTQPPPPRTSPPRTPSPRPQGPMKPTVPPAGGFTRPISPRPQQAPAPVAGDATASISTLLPSPSAAPPSPPDTLATSPRGPALASPSRARANLRHPSPLPPVPAPQTPVGGIVLPLQHSPRQASPSPRTLATASPAREQK